MNKASYRHPYGGVAHDIVVKRDRFCRLFDISDHQIEHLPINCKVGDRMCPSTNGRKMEVLGYIRRGPRGGLRFVTVYVQY